MSSWELYETSPNKLTNKVLGKNLELNFSRTAFQFYYHPFIAFPSFKENLCLSRGHAPRPSQQV